MIIGGNRGGLVKSFPHVPGVDMVAEVIASDSPTFALGTQVLLTGYRYGELFWGGYASYARAKKEHVVPLPKNLPATQGALLGTAGLTAMLAIQTLVGSGLSPQKKMPVVVTGATGGVGSWAVRMLAALGYTVVAVTRRPEQFAKALLSSGAHEVTATQDFNLLAKKPLATARFQGAIDTLGGTPLSSIIAQLRYGGAVACCGLVEGTSLQSTLFPLLLRGVRILGIDSVMASADMRHEAWHAIASLCADVSIGKNDEDVWEHSVTLDQIPAIARDMLSGKTHGRTLVTLADSLAE